MLLAIGLARGFSCRGETAVTGGPSDDWTEDGLPCNTIGRNATVFLACGSIEAVIPFQKEDIILTS